MSRALAFTIINAVLFQTAWFVCILWGDIAAVLFAVPAFIFHFIFTNSKLIDAISAVIAVAIGLLHDSILIHSGLIVFAESSVFPPLWLVCLWAMLGLTLNHSMKWIYLRPLWSSILGAISGPLSYLAGVELSEAHWSSPMFNILPIMVVIPLIAFMWLFVLPLHRVLSLRLLSYVACKNNSVIS